MFKQNSNLNQEEQAVTANPDTFVVDLKEEKPIFILIGCDGIFDRFNNAYICKHFSMGLKDGK